jgi:DNA-binding winged helix-turn-helix (wHTH) protein/TolB-like protein/Tfp pilus assembly protein PilF
LELSTFVHFDDFELDLRARLLTRVGQPVPLNPRTFDLLVYLAARPQQLVTREELINALWPDSFVDDGNLSQHVFLLRKALTESGGTARIVRTIPGRGYEFTSRIVPGALAISEPALLAQHDLQMHAAHSITRVVLEEETEEDAPSRLRMRHLAFALGALAMLAVLAGLWTARRAWLAARAPTLSIAVLPFANRTGDTSQNYVCSGLADELIGQLDRFPVRQLRVVAPDFSSIDAARPVSQIGRDLGVQYVLEGSLQQQGAYVRVSAQLVRVSDQSRVWSSVYDGDPSDEFVFESSIADAVEHTLSLHLPPLAQAAYRPEKFAARDAYLKGLYFFSQRTKPAFETAIENFSNALAIDPKYSAAYAQLASTYNLMGQYNWITSDSARSLGLAAAQQALSLDPAQPEAHAALGFSYWYYQWNLTAAEQEFRKAIELDHANIDAHHWYAQMLMTAGRFPEAERQMQSALDIDPVSPILRTNLGWLSYYEGNFPQAVQQMQAVLNANPNFIGAHYKLWYVYAAMGDRDRSLHEFFPWFVRDIADPVEERRLQDAYNSGGYDAALRACGTDSTSNYGSSVDGARCLLVAGDRDGAIALLQRAYQFHEGWIIFVPVDPIFAPLRGDARFQSIVQNIEKRK